MDRTYDYIKESIETYRKKDPRGWLEPLITFNKLDKSPFNDYDQSDFSSNPEFMKTPAISLFNSPLIQMKVVFTDIFRNIENTGNIAYDYLQTLPPNEDHLDPSYDCSFLAQKYLSLQPKDSQAKLSHFDYLSLSIDTFTTEFSMIEPIMLVLGLYNIKEQRYLTETRTFIPQASIEFLYNVGIDVNIPVAQTFKYDSKFADQSSTFIVVNFVHPTTTNNGYNVIKYYQSRTDVNNMKARECIADSFQRNHLIYSTFAFSYLPIEKYDQMFPDPFVIDCPISENEIVNFMANSINNKYKRVEIHLQFKKGCDTGSIIRPIFKYRPQPYLIPINQLVVKPQSINLNTSFFTKGRNLIMGLKIVTEQNGEPIKCWLNQFSPKDKTSFVYTRCWYHEKNPVFDDCFTAFLPYPLPTTSLLVADVLHVVVQKSDESLYKVGSVAFPLFDNDGAFIANGNHAGKIVFSDSGNENSSSLKLNTFLRSTFFTPEDSYNEILTTGSVNEGSLQNITNETLVNNFFLILDSIIKKCVNNEGDFMNVLVDYIKKVNAGSDRLLVEKNLMIYVCYFAMRNVTSNSVKAPKTRTRKIQKNNSVSMFDVFNFELSDSMRSMKKSTLDPSNTVPLYSKLMLQIMAFIERRGQNIELVSDFLLVLMIKAIALEAQNINAKEFKKFVTSWSKLVVDSGKNGIILARSHGMFINLLFDIGRYSEAVSAFNIQFNALLSKSSVTTLSHFLDFSFRPFFFYFAIKDSASFRTSMSLLLKNALFDESLSFSMNVMLSVLSEYEKSYASDVADALFETIYIPNVSRPNSETEPIAVVYYYLFIFLYSTKENIQNENVVFDVLHSLLKFLASESKSGYLVDASSLLFSKEQPSTKLHPLNIFMHRSNSLNDKSGKKPLLIGSKSCTMLLNIIRNGEQIILTFSNKLKSVSDSLGLIYHLLFISNETLMILQCANRIIDLIKKDVKAVIASENPGITYVLKKLVTLTTDQCKKEIAQIMASLIEEETKCVGSHASSTSLLYKILSMISPEEIIEESIVSLFDFFQSFYGHIPGITDVFNVYVIYRNIAKALKSTTISNYQKQDMMFYLLKKLNYSPDAQILILQQINKLNAKNSREDLNVIVLQASIIIESLTKLGITPCYFKVDHPCSLFSSICPLSSEMCSPFDKSYIGKPASLCDLTCFSNIGYQNTIRNAMEVAAANNYYDIMLQLFDFIFPVLVGENICGITADFLNFFNTLIVSGTRNDDIMELLFKVSFYGSIFGSENEKSYIYNAKMLSNLFSFSSGLLNEYKKIYGENIVISNESKVVDKSILRSNSGVIQIIAVKRVELQDKIFYYDVPFVKDSSKLQGTIETQWIRRTVIETESALPSVVSRSIVKPIIRNTKEFSPIQVARRQIDERTISIKQAIDEKDYTKIQQLLHGSILVQVNEGPAKIAETFLKDKYDIRKRKKLINSFKKFTNMLEIGVKIHEEWVAENQAFEALQIQLELGLKDFKTKMNCYY